MVQKDEKQHLVQHVSHDAPQSRDGRAPFPAWAAQKAAQAFKRCHERERKVLSGEREREQ